jgi:hypothetical protein
MCLAYSLFGVSKKAQIRSPAFFADERENHLMIQDQCTSMRSVSSAWNATLMYVAMFLFLPPQHVSRLAFVVLQIGTVIIDSGLLFNNYFTSNIPTPASSAAIANKYNGPACGRILYLNEER